jgi:hypothetical protein
MSKSFFPVSDPKMVIWATNFKLKIGIYATELNLTDDEVDEQIGYCDEIINSVNNVSDKRAQIKAALDARKSTLSIAGSALRAAITRHKSKANFTNAIGQDLGIITQNVGIDFSTYKARFTAEHYGGVIRIKFKKKYADGINLYRRKKGTTFWVYLARATKNPFDHNFSLEMGGQPEHWEYRAFGVVNDTEIGVASDIVEVIYGN